MSPSFSTSRPSTPVSSRTSRIAVSAADSPASTWPFGSAQTRSLPRGRIAASIVWPRIVRTSTPPAENSRSILARFYQAADGWHLHGPSDDRTMHPALSRGECQETVAKAVRRLCMNLKPLGDRLIVEVLEEEETTTSGIVLPDTAKEKPQRGRVLAVGPGSRDDDGKCVPMDLEDGDEIVFSKYGGTEIRVGTDEYLILRESDVLAKVTGDREPAGATA